MLRVIIILITIIKSVIRYIRNLLYGPQKFEMAFVSSVQIVNEIAVLLATRPFKITKRLERLRMTCELLDKTLDEVMGDNDILSESTIKDPSTAQILRLINKPPEYRDNISYFKIVHKAPDMAAKYIDSILTEYFNKGYKTYLYAAQIMCELEKLLLMNPYIKQLHSDGKFVVVCCGGVASRISLIDEFPQFADRIKRTFKLGGDNDVKILIDPSIGDTYHNKARTICANIILSRLYVERTKINRKLVSYAKNITHIQLNKEITKPIKISSRRNVRITYATTKGIAKSELHGDSLFAYVIYNNTLRIANEGKSGGVCVFDLIRIKCAFEFSSGASHSSEFLDISILHDTDTRFALDYPMYANKKYIRNILLPTEEMNSAL